MSLRVEIPVDLQPLVHEAITKGHCRNEQELITQLLRLAIPAMDDYRTLHQDVQISSE